MSFLEEMYEKTERESILNEYHQHIIKWQEKFPLVIQNTELLRESIKSIKNYPALEHTAQIIFALRTKATDLFKAESVRNVCSNCKGTCCGKIDGPSLEELMWSLFVPKHKNHFTWPEPDWNFLYNYIQPEYATNPDLERTGGPTQPCLFLNKKGCALGNWRPLLCLNHICPKLRQANPELQEKITHTTAQIKNFMRSYSEKSFSVRQIASFLRNNRFEFGSGSALIILSAENLEKSSIPWLKEKSNEIFDH